MVVFALVNSANVGGYYIASNRASMGWRELPHDLAREMEDVREKGEEVEEVSIGLDGGWFLRTDARQSCKSEFEQSDISSNVEVFVRLMQQAGLSLAQYSVLFFTFVPDRTGYVTVLHKTDGSFIRCAWHNVPRQLDEVLGREASNGVRHVAVGKHGSYVVLMNTGAMWWGGVPDSLHHLLDDALKKGREVVTVSLSLISDNWYFIEFADGATNYFLPPVWHESVNKFTAQTIHLQFPKMCSSSSRAPSPVPLDHPPQQQGQFGPLRSLHQSRLAKPLGYIPFVTNEFLAAVFTGTIQQQQRPVYNITNVYNYPMPQTQQRETSTVQEVNDVVTLLDSGLKLVGMAPNLTLLVNSALGLLGLAPGFGC